MSIQEMLARPLAHGVQYDQIARATLRQSDPLDVEWLIAGLPAHQEHLIRARYQHDVASKSKAWSWLFARAMGEGWSQNAPPGTVERLAMLALAYWLGWSFDDHGKKILSAHICRTCEGVGELIAEAKVIVCMSCDGSGRIELGPYTIQRQIGITAHRRTAWVDRCAVVIGWMDAAEGDAVRHMVAKLRD